MAAGHQAALSIHRYLRGEALVQPEAETNAVLMEAADLKDKALRGELTIGKRPIMPALAAAQRVSHFQEVELGYTEISNWANGRWQITNSKGRSSFLNEKRPRCFSAV